MLQRKVELLKVSLLCVKGNSPPFDGHTPVNINLQQSVHATNYSDMKVFHLLFLVYPLFFNLTCVLQFRVLISCISQNDIHQPPKDGRELVAFREGERERSSGNNGVITMRVPVELVLHSGPLVLVWV